MNLRIAWQVLKKDLRLGPRSPILLWAIVFPLVGTFVIQIVFGSLFAPQPRLGIVDEGGSEVAVEMASVEGIETIVGVTAYGESWADVTGFLLMSAAWCVVIFAAGWFVLRRRVEAL